MATTAGELITEALSLIGVVGGGESASGQDMETCLYSLNSMLDSWNTEPLSVIAVVYSVLAGYASASFTAGPGGNINGVRPVGVADGSFSRVSGTDYPIDVVSSYQYSAIERKAETASSPSCIWYSGSAPLAVCYLWPVPTGAGDLHIALNSLVSEFATISDSASLPQGYRRAIAYSLAEDIAPKFGRPIEADIVRKAAVARRNLKRSHAEVPRLRMNATISGPGA